MSYLTAALYDTVIAHAERLCLTAHRKSMLAPLEGRVLELGSGTGKNLPYYSTQLERLVLSEPDPHMRKRLRTRLAEYSTSAVIELSEASAEQLPFASSEFDQVVSTLVYCSVTNLRQSLAETYRVLAPGGTLTLMEHIAAPLGTGRRRWQERLDPIWSRATGGCHLNRDPRLILRELGFHETSVALDDLRGAPGFQKLLLCGTWQKA